jgi:tRNA threonylcarbamoyladenosine biosynthesis protein TsaE
MSRIITTQSELETAAAGRALAGRLTAGSVVLLFGELGAGKTAFVRGLAEGLGIPPSEVSSPTFTIVQEYRGGRLPLFHADLYRLDDPREVDELGLDEIAAGGVLAIEWADKLNRPFSASVETRITHGADDTRTISIDLPPTPNGSSAPLS